MWVLRLLVISVLDRFTVPWVQLSRIEIVQGSEDTLKRPKLQHCVANKDMNTGNDRSTTCDIGIFKVDL